MFSKTSHPSYDPSELALLQKAFAKASSTVSPRGYEERWQLANAILAKFSGGAADENTLVAAAVRQLNGYRTGGATAPANKAKVAATA